MKPATIRSRGARTQRHLLPHILFATLLLMLTIIKGQSFAAPSAVESPSTESPAPTEAGAEAAASTSTAAPAPAEVSAPAAELKPAAPPTKAYSAEEIAEIKEKARVDALRYADRGNRHLWIAYSLIWLFIFLFIFRTWKRSAALEGELEDVKRRLRAIDAGERGAQ